VNRTEFDEVWSRETARKILSFTEEADREVESCAVWMVNDRMGSAPPVCGRDVNGEY
jgi:hypothetical protein